MSRLNTTAALLMFVWVVGACSAQGPGGVPYDTQSSRPQATGATVDGNSGAISGTTAAPEKKEQRGNTPPGTSRDGQGPAGGAIVDPTGAVTRGK